MTSIVYLLRHAQSADKQNGQRDFDRLLTPEGEAESEKLALLLTTLPERPTKIISSPALRARQTALPIQRALQIDNQQMEFPQGVYECFPDDWMSLIQENKTKCIMLIGHNPVISSVASILCGKAISLAPCECIAYKIGEPKELFHYTPGLK